MKRIASIAAGAAAVLVIHGAHAQQQVQTPSPVYGELGYTFLEFRDNFGFRANPSAIRAILGYNFHPNLAAEGMLAFGAADDSDQGVTLKLRDAYGVFAKPRIEFNNLEVFARLGWVHERSRVSAGPIALHDSDSDFAWGLGASYNFNPRTYASLDYMRYIDKGATRIDGWTLGLGLRF